MENRYKIISGSQTGSIFSFTIVDSKRPVMIHGQHFDNQYHAMCECMDHKDAQQITKAMNDHKPKVIR